MDFKKLKCCLQEKILNNRKAYIVAHEKLDVDALASALGLYDIVEHLGGDACIVNDDSPLLVEQAVKKIIDETSLYTSFCKSDEIKISGNDILILTDVSKINRICLKDKVKQFDLNNIIILDHHAADEFTINTPNLFIDENISSACEIVGRLLAIMNISLSRQKLYSYLYAGIILDTQKFTTKNTSPRTMSTAAFLMENGANVQQANSLFTLDFAADRRMQKLVEFANSKTLKTSIAMDIESPMTIYLKEDIARAADYLLTFDIDSAFALGFIKENLVAISARSNGNVNVGKIMRYYGGGGNICSAAANINTSDIKDVYDDLNNRTNLEPTLTLKYTPKL